MVDLNATTQTSQGITQTRRSWVVSLAPLLVCLLITLVLRIFFIIHTGGVIDGDEASTAIQAQNILRGTFPTYYYGQAYFGSLEAYLIAILFALFGSSVWTLRAEPTILSLLIVALTWVLAGEFADLAQISQKSRRFVQTIAALCAAIPPLYDGLIQERAWGGWIEVYVVILLLLLAAIRLTRRWQAGAGQWELLWRWAWLGYLVGLALWIYPLIITAIGAAVIWIGGWFILQMVRSRSRQLLRQLLLAIIAIPFIALGMLPALVWGAANQWANMAFIFGLGGTGSETLHVKISNVVKVTRSFGTCIAPRLIGGGLPGESGLILTLHNALFILGLGCIILVAGACLGGKQAQSVRQMIALPALFAGCAVFCFCVAAVSESELIGCQFDDAGRYATPLMLVLPFFFAMAFFLVWKRFEGFNLAQATPLVSKTLLILALVLFLGTQALTYGQTKGGQAFQSPYCSADPYDNGPILNYLEAQHIHYIWSPAMLGSPLMFKSQLTIINADPLAFAHIAVDRIPAYTQAVAHADRPSVLVIVPHNSVGSLPLFNSLGVTYHYARLVSQPGYDVLVITPLNRSFPPLELSKLGIFICVAK